MRKTTLILVLFSLTLIAGSCRRRASDAVTVALPEKFSGFDTLTNTAPTDAAAERVKNLIFNALVKKNENFEYVGELAKEIRTSEDGMFTRRFLCGLCIKNRAEFAENVKCNSCD